jgi:asparagine synthase (glutamine-hydrolysing)
MCGIAGKYSLDGVPADRGLLGRMAGAMVHRGPDDEGFYINGPFGMTMRRLSIIDLGAGHQPICNEDGSVWVVFNGEIYNYVELREELRARGHRFKTNTDTEVIVHLYEDLGDKCMLPLRGMFSLAVWDERAQSLLLSRDRLGKKPLYYSFQPGRALVFGSELKAVLEDAAVDREIDLEALDQYATFLYVPSPASIFRSVRKLPAGHSLVCTRAGMTVKRYWEAPVPSADVRHDDVLERFQELLTEAVRIRLRSDVPVGAFLSGGIDSSVVVATMARLLDRPVVTTSIGFEEDGYSELPYARLVARHVGSDHHEHVVTAPTPELIERIAWHLDEPFADSSAVPTWFVSKAAREHVTVALSGDGGDELFAGYARHRNEGIEHAARRRVGRLGGRALGMAAALLPEGTKARLALLDLALSPEEACARKFWFTPRVAKLKAGLYTPWLREAAAGADPIAQLRDAFRRANGTDPVSRILNVDLSTAMCDDILTKVDRMSMAHSLEVRAPLLDHKLVEFVMSLPPSWKLNGGTTKALLRRVLDGAVPREAFDRPKHGFTSPIRGWLRGPLAGYVEDTILSRRAMERGYFDPAAVRRLWTAHRSGGAGYEHEVWMLLMLETWHRTFVDRARTP